MTKSKLNALKRQASKHLVLGILMFTLGTIPVIFQWGNGDHTGSVFCWMMSAMIIDDSVRKLIKLNKRG